MDPLTWFAVQTVFSALMQSAPAQTPQPQVTWSWYAVAEDQWAQQFTMDSQGKCWAHRDLVMQDVLKQYPNALDVIQVTECYPD